MKNKVYTGVWVPEKILSTKIKSGNERLLLAMIFELSKIHYDLPFEPK